MEFKFRVENSKMFIKSLLSGNYTVVDRKSKH